MATQTSPAQALYAQHRCSAPAFTITGLPPCFQVVVLHSGETQPPKGGNPYIYFVRFFLNNPITLFFFLIENEVNEKKNMMLSSDYIYCQDMTKKFY